MDLGSESYCKIVSLSICTGNGFYTVFVITVFVNYKRQVKIITNMKHKVKI